MGRELLDLPPRLTMSSGVAVQRHRHRRYMTARYLDDCQCSIAALEKAINVQEVEVSERVPTCKGDVCREAVSNLHNFLAPCVRRPVKELSREEAIIY